MKQEAARAERPWALGNIDEGQGVVRVHLRGARAKRCRRGSTRAPIRSGDRLWIDAYERMALDDAHSWHRHAEAEALFITKQLGLAASTSIMDIGCGDGRHAAAFSALGLSTNGVDIAPRLVARAKENYPNLQDQFAVADGRAELPDNDYDAATLLYDAIGSSANVADDRALLQRAKAVLRIGGWLVASVMNAEPILATLPAEHRATTQAELVTMLEGLTPSSNMETTGDVFDPKYLLLYRDTFYRKEQFVREGDHLRLRWSFATDVSLASRSPSCWKARASRFGRFCRCRPAGGTEPPPWRLTIAAQKSCLSLLR